LPRRGAAATDTAARAEVGADAGRNAALQRLSVSAAPVTGGEPRIELIGHLTALLRAGGAEGLPVFGHAKSPLAVANGLVEECSTLVDAGTGYQRSQYVEVAI
jgi:hypothetical protein